MLLYFLHEVASMKVNLRLSMYKFFYKYFKENLQMLTSYENSCFQCKYIFTSLFFCRIGLHYIKSFGGTEQLMMTCGIKNIFSMQFQSESSAKFNEVYVEKNQGTWK